MEEKAPLYADMTQELAENTGNRCRQEWGGSCIGDLKEGGMLVDCDLNSNYIED